MSFPTEQDVTAHLRRFRRAIAEGRTADAEHLAHVIEMLDSVTLRAPSYRRQTYARLMATEQRRPRMQRPGRAPRPRS